LNKKLFIQAIGKYLAGLIFVSILLFIPAGTLHYWNAWLLIGVKGINSVKKINEISDSLYEILG
jgi:hypothetical protein